MKVLYVFRSLAFWGGIERILVDKMNHLSADFGYDVYMLTADQGTHSMPYELNSNIHFEDLNIRLHQQYNYRGARRLWEHIRLKRSFEAALKERIDSIAPDVIACVATGYADSIVKASGTTPVVVESHSTYMYTFEFGGLFQRLQANLLKKRLRLASAIVTLTEGDADKWRQHYPKVRVIPNMVNLNEKPLSTQTSKRAIFVGRLDYQKQVLEALRLWAMIQQDFPDWTLDIYGEGEQSEMALQAIREQKLNATLHKPTARIQDCYRKSAFLISTSKYEPFGLVISEAMSCGLPAIAYDCPYGPAELISDGRDGFLVESNDHETFARRMRQLMGSQELRLEMGRHAAKAAQCYAAERIMPAWKELFEELTR